MPFRSIIAEPQELAALSAAFDAAWIEINQRVPIHPLAVPAARERLGYIILGLWKAEPSQDFARVAAEQFASAPDFTLSAPANLS